jgi:hypothetical protein
MGGDQKAITWSFDGGATEQKIKVLKSHVLPILFLHEFVLYNLWW